MTYSRVGSVKSYLGITATTDDALIENVIEAAQKVIENYTGRVFACLTDTTRHFIVGEDTVGQKLWLGDDLASITSVVNDADGTPTTLVNGTDYLPIPRDKTPYSGLRLLSSSSAYWDYTNDPETGITVSGKWAYSTTPPDDIVHACTRLAAYFYRQKDAQTFDTTAIPDAGVMLIPQGIPKDVKMILDNYKKAKL